MRMGQRERESERKDERTSVGQKTITYRIGSTIFDHLSCLSTLSNHPSDGREREREKRYGEEKAD